jgi:hypothetical protein
VFLCVSRLLPIHRATCPSPLTDGVFALCSCCIVASCCPCVLGVLAAHEQHVATVGDVLTTLNISFLVDDSNNSIGRRYARTDEIGIPFAITVENTLGVSGTVTLRDRDSCGQVRRSRLFPTLLPWTSLCDWAFHAGLSTVHATLRCVSSSSWCLAWCAVVISCVVLLVLCCWCLTPQVRLPLADLASVVQQLCEHRLGFADLLTRWARWHRQAC